MSFKIATDLSNKAMGSLKDLVYLEFERYDNKVKDENKRIAKLEHHAKLLKDLELLMINEDDQILE